MVSSESNCGFVFVPIEYDRKESAINALKNFTNIHMYDQRLNIGIGVLMYYNKDEKYHDILWMYKNHRWVQDLEFEKAIYPNFPFTKLTSKKDYRYYINEKE